MLLRHPIKLLLATAPVVVLGATPVQAAESVSDGFIVSATLKIEQPHEAKCSLTAKNIDFGTITLEKKQKKQGVLSVKCEKGVKYELTVNEGSHAAGGQQRQMKHATQPATLNYDLLYRGKPITPNDHFVSDTATGNTTPIRITGQISGVQTKDKKPDGKYTDKLTATVSF